MVDFLDEADWIDFFFQGECDSILKNYKEQRFYSITDSKMVWCLDKLAIANLAISVNASICNSEFCLEQHLYETALREHAAVNYSNQEENLTAFLNSIYMTDFAYQEFRDKHKFEYKYGKIRFLFIQRLQAEVEKALITYIHTPKAQNLNYQSDKKVISVYQKKTEAYIKLLRSVALYEIFLLAYENQTKEEIEKYLFDKLQFLRKRKNLDLFHAHMKFEQKEREAYNELINEIMGLYHKEFYQESFIRQYRRYYIRHGINLSAIFCIIYLIEFVNNNLGNKFATTELEKRAFSDANNWYLQNRKISLNETKTWEFQDLFCPMEQFSQDNSTLYERMNQIYYKHRIFPICENENTFEDFTKKVSEMQVCLEQYISLIEQHTVLERSEEEEKQMWKLADILAKPIKIAIDDILQNK